jgi:bifunctional non-homologous end joining protein LigD
MAKLEEYKRKRRFDRTPEPSGEPDAVEAEVPKAKERGIPRSARNDGASEPVGGEASKAKEREISRSARNDRQARSRKTIRDPKGANDGTAGGKPEPVAGEASKAKEREIPRSARNDGTAGKRTRLPKPKLPQLEVRPGAEHGDTFVVQKHRATRLHYDFRLAIDGTLKSWAVPKGPSQSHADKRLAVHVEDHPLDYANFEGKIPEGNYGAGTVMVWDRGTFHVEGSLDALKQLAKGEIKFSLNGEKLKGSFVLVKLKQSEKGNEWLMIKHKDAAEDSSWNIDEHDGSVLTGRSIEEIKEELPPKRRTIPIQPCELQGARKSAMPSRVEPMLATLTDHPFSDPNWLFEIKWDGVRALARIENRAFTLRSRNSIDFTQRYPELASLPDALAARQAILDGEIVALDAQGRGDFERLQERMHVRAPAENLVAKMPVVYFAFDLLYCDGYDLRGAPLLERKQLLQRLLFTSERFRYADHQVEHGKELFELAKETGLEGIVAKRADSPYVSDRSPYWVKLKITKTVDAVIGGWTEARTAALPFGSLLLGLYQGKKLRFIGHVGSGFDAKKLEELSGKLKKLAASASPFDTVPETNEKPSWISPQLVARVKFSGWTQEHSLRHPVFLALREDARPADCQWENEVAAAEPATAPAVVRAPEVVGKVLNTTAQIENELFKGRSENVTIQLDGKRLRLSNLNKVYFPESGYTKRNLLAYYYRMADFILPFLRDRALVLRRYPDGIKGQAFFQKDLREGVPEWFKTVPIDSEKKGEAIHYATANDRASLLFLTGLGCIDHNPWSNRYDDFDHPDYFFFDLDPSDGTEFSVVVTIAQALHKKLEELRLASFLKTSGATGMHIYIPVEPVYTYEQLRTFGEIIARTVTAEHPNLVTSERIVAKRPAGRVLIDVQQNAHGRPLAAAYSVRAFPQAPVSAPLLPRELRASLRPETLNIKTVFARLKEKGDLWADFWKRRQRLEQAIELLSDRIPPKTKKSP